MDPNDQTVFLPILLDKTSDEADLLEYNKKEDKYNKISFNQQISVIL